MRFRQQAKEYARGAQVENPHPAIVMFSTCASMKFAHLPIGGGVYDQDPMLLHYWRILWEEQSTHEKAQARRREAEAKRKRR